MDIYQKIGEISLLINEPNYLEFEIINKLSDEYKKINIITNNIKKFDKIFDEVYQEKGLTLNITNNYKKASLKSKIVFNFDFNEKEFRKN